MNMQIQDVNRFEFLLTLENNIVIQRFFNVPNYGSKSLVGLELYECVRDICNEIAMDLKWKTLDYLNDNADYFFDMEPSEVIKEKEEWFSLSIKLGEKVFITRIFPAHVYHPKVRYAVDIRPKVRKFLTDLTNVLSSSEVTTEYLETEL
jgi:hypothetical protein